MTPAKKRKRDLVKVCRSLSPAELRVLEPWFRSRQESNKIRRTKTVPELRKWGVYFGIYGCLVCGTNKRIHVGLGFCSPCHATVVRRLKEILKETVRRA